MYVYPMPTYDYKCSDCGRIFEKFHGINETPSVSCPECNSLKTEKQISLGAGVIFKGSGFYVTDYKNQSGKTGNTGSSATATETKAPETKPAENKSEHNCCGGCSH